MKHIRSLILALVLSAGLAPAFAQAPPPVPALPDTERRTSYVISASTCACAVGFQLYQDSTDVANWLTVYINGVQIPQSGNWNITSPSGPIATLPRPISDGVLTFTTARTGTVQIVGAQRPRRLSEYSENRGVAARDLNQAINGIEAQLREMWDRQFRTVQAPPGETLNVLPAQASRASMGACFDSNGNLAPCVAGTGSFIAGSGIGFTGSNPTTIAYTGATYSAGTGIIFTGSNPTVISKDSTAAPYVMPSDYGITCDGVTNWSTQLQTMITASAGKIILIPAGPACITNTTLTLPSNTTITGAGREVSVLSGNALPLLSAVDKTNISLTNFWLKGTRNVVSWAASPVGALAFTQTVAAVADQIYTIQNMKFSNFNTSYWIYIVSTTNSFLTIKNFTFSDNYMLTAAGDIPNDANPLNNNNYGLYMLSSSAGKGRIDNPLVKNNLVESIGMCFPISVTGNSYKLQITENLITNAGVTNARVNGHCLSGDGNTDLSYGINVYDSWGDGNPPTNFLVSSNTIIAPYATGIYIVGDGTVGHSAAIFNSSGSIVSNNLIDGQLSQTDATLPRAGIAVALMTDIDVIGNKVRNSFGGIVATGQTTGLVNIVGNSCTTAVGAITSTPFCYKIASGGNSGGKRQVLKANYGESANTTTGSVVIMTSAVGVQFYDVEISQNTVIAGFNGLSAANQFFLGMWTIADNKFINANTGTMINIGGLTGSIYMANNGFYNNGTGVSGMLFASLPAAVNGSQIYLSNGAPGSSPCTGASSGSLATRQNGAWKCF